MAAVETRAVGTSRGHAGQAPTSVEAIELSAGDLRAEVWTYGATLVRLDVPDRGGERSNVIRSQGELIADDVPSYRRGCGGATIGRYANRIAGSRFELDGMVHRLMPNEGVNQLHGGPIGFDRSVWDATTSSDHDSATVELALISAAGDQGFPGRLEVRIKYILDSTSISFDYAATTDAPTVVALTNHAYWNLAGGGHVGGHELQLSSSRYVSIDADRIPTGELAPVGGTRFDFRRADAIGRHLDPETGRGFDHCFVLDGREVAATLSDPSSGRRMTVTTDQPGIQLYTADHIDPPGSALCLEAEVLPDTPNRPEFGSAVLRPGETYRQTTRHAFDWS
ncbi:aldose epimerase family protein [Ilumatobacter nonamiensis]|uniref:aldose epimerase family protein n=1 Tax=Ilumatobacter nonamiensis TaxID=467093 RepID=UPI0003471FF3|nr:aldose epimerase family protein [Ilumatobacter nonamiensis]